jgi:tetratricopeptide (TPR) repeat protein
MRKKLLGPEDPAVARSLNILATLLLTENRLDEAEPMFREALAIRRQRPAKEQIDLAASLNNLAITVARQDKMTEAEALHREALAMRRKLLGNLHREVLASLSGLLDVLRKERNHAAAESLILESNEIIQQLPQATPSEKRAAMERLRGFYIDWAATAPGTGKLTKASEWSDRLREFDELAKQPAQSAK